MSAWAQLIHWDGSDEFLELCNAALLEVQREHAHRLAEEVRTDAGEWDGWPEKQASMRYAADLIDPKVVDRG